MWKFLTKIWEDWIQRRPAVGVSFGLAGALLLSLEIAERLSARLAPHLIIKASKEGEGLELQAGWYVLDIVWLAIAVTIFLLAAGIISSSIIRAKRQPQKFNARESELLDAYKDVVESAKSLANSSHQNVPHETIRLNVNALDILIDVYEDLEAKVTKTYEFQCGDHPAHQFKYWFTADDGAPEFDTIHPTEFRVQVLEGSSQVLWLPVGNDPRRKEVCIFFVPPLQPGQTMQIRVSYSWPRFFSDLETKGRSEYNMSAKWSEKPGRMSCAFNFDRKIGDVGAESASNIDSQKLKFKDEKSTRTWTYADEAFRFDGTTYMLRFLLLEKKKAA